MISFRQALGSDLFTFFFVLFCPSDDHHQDVPLSISPHEGSTRFPVAANNVVMDGVSGEKRTTREDNESVTMRQRDSNSTMAMDIIVDARKRGLLSRLHIIYASYALCDVRREYKFLFARPLSVVSLQGPPFSPFGSLPFSLSSLCHSRNEFVCVCLCVLAVCWTTTHTEMHAPPLKEGQPSPQSKGVWA